MRKEITHDHSKQKISIFILVYFHLKIHTYVLSHTHTFFSFYVTKITIYTNVVFQMLSSLFFLPIQHCMLVNFSIESLIIVQSFLSNIIFTILDQFTGEWLSRFRLLSQKFLTTFARYNPNCKQQPEWSSENINILVFSALLKLFNRCSLFLG